MSRQSVLFLFIIQLFWSPCNLFAAAPALVVVPAGYDFGEVRQGDRLEQTFRLRNNGKVPLEILNVKTSCGCTVAKTATEKLLPGESTDLQVVFDTASFSDRTSKTVYVSTSDPVRPTTAITLKADIRPEVVLEPAIIDFGALVPGESKSSAVQLRNQGRKSFNVQRVESTVAGVGLEYRAGSVAPGDAFRLNVTVKGPNRGERLGGYVLIYTDREGAPVTRLPIYAGGL